MAWTTLCDRGELTEGQGKYVEIDGFQLAVFVDAGEPRTIDNTCPHAGGSFAEGFVEDGCAVCPLHYWAFNLQSGELRDSPGVVVKVYPTRVHPYQGRELVQADLPMF